MKSLDRHCHDIYKILGNRTNFDDDWVHLAEWLHIASGITDVYFNASKFDRYIWYCSNARYIQEQKSNLYSDYLSKLVSFNFVWGALETLIDLIDPEKAPIHAGKVNNACFYIMNRFDGELDYYAEVLHQLEDLLFGHYTQFEDALPNPDDKRMYWDFNGAGLQIVKKIRNKFAHGSICFPSEERDFMEDERHDMTAIELSIRLVCFSIQMLVIALFKDQHRNIMFYDFDVGDFVESDLVSEMRKVHLDKVSQQ